MLLVEYDYCKVMVYSILFLHLYSALSIIKDEMTLSIQHKYRQSVIKGKIELMTFVETFEGSERRSKSQRRVEVIPKFRRDLARLGKTNRRWKKNTTEVLRPQRTGRHI